MLVLLGGIAASGLEPLCLIPMRHLLTVVHAANLDTPFSGLALM
nr:MAG TPA: hypothetical protein [Caudoviricetes sp.]